MAWYVLVPIIIGLLLWIAKPNLILERDAQGNIVQGNIDWSRFIIWLIIFTIIIWVILWLLLSVVNIF